MNPLQNPPYRYLAPSIQPECAEVSLSDFSKAQIEAHLDFLNKTPQANQGYEAGASITSSEAARIATLNVCGQREEARDELCRIIGLQIGRAL